MKRKTIIAAFLSLTLFVPTINFAAETMHSSHRGKIETTKVVNINQADAKTLATLKDIGAKKADAIVAYRIKNGSFKSVQELTNVKGISQKILNDNKGHMEV